MADETTLTRLRDLRRWQPVQPPGERTQVISDIFQQHRPAMLRLALLLVDDQHSAEDVVQDAFAGFYRSYAGLIDPVKAPAYLRSAVLNNARSALRRRRTARAYVPPHGGDRPFRGVAGDARPGAPGGGPGVTPAAGSAARDPGPCDITRISPRPRSPS